MASKLGVSYFANGRAVSSAPHWTCDARPVLFGESVFETMRAYSGRVFELEAHLQRLKRSAAWLGLQLPMSVGELSREVQDSLAESTHDDAALRLTLFRDSELKGLSHGGVSETSRILTISPLTLPDEATYERGIRVSCERVERHSSSGAAPAKAANYLANIVALAAAERNGADDALLTSIDGYALGGSSSNIFAVRAGVLFTPPLGGGILSGVTREVVLRLAAELGIPAQITWLTVADVVQATELFLSSSLRELMPIAMINGTPLAGPEERPITSQLRRAFSALTRTG